MKIEEVRKRFLSFMESKGHAVIESASVVPQDDSTTLFTGSGMQPLIPYLLGKKHPKGVRLANSQKCFRANDIDEVGDNRHTTFFEMLGNWSLGDYFKEEQIKQFFEFLIDSELGLGLDPRRLYVTVFAGDEKNGLPKDSESALLWQEVFVEKGIDAEIAVIGSQEEGDARGMQDGERIFFYNADKNWWSRSSTPDKMPVGEIGGPDTEVFYDFGEEYTDPAYAHLQPHPNSNSGRFIEVGNSVFMEYQKTEAGFDLLPQKNVDFGGGLERLASATSHNPDIFQTDIFKEVLETLGGSYEKDPRPYRVIADHLRSAVFMIADGVVPGNTGAGYVLRRLIRRFVYHMQYSLGTDVSIEKMIDKIVDGYKDTYPELSNVNKLVAVEEAEKFNETLSKGIKMFEKFAVEERISAENGFTLQSTYGFPVELTEELAKKQRIPFDSGGCESLMQKHRELSKCDGNRKFKGGLGDQSEKSIRFHTATHLLHQALRDVLGNHVEQRGSNVTPDRLRFDFTHHQKLTNEEKKKVEKIVNEKISADLPVEFKTMKKEQAYNKGAIGIFKDTYGDDVKVYTIGNYSMEFCDGPHVGKTSEIGKILIAKEESIAQGVRRIKAVFGDGE